MKQQIATTKDQCARLLRCGVSADTADMCWYKAKSPNKEGYSWMLISENYLKRRSSDEFVPAWSLSALLGLLPFKIHSGKYEYWLDIAPMDYGRQWSIGYYCMDKPRVIKGLTHTDSLIECAVQEIEWLTSNGYKLNDCPCQKQGGKEQ